MLRYVAHGLRIRSSLALPELATDEAADAPWDVDIRVGKAPGPPLRAIQADMCGHITSRETHLSFEGAASFVIRDGNQIVVDPSPAVDERFLRLLILGRAMAVLLHQRGVLTLHGSAAAVNGSSVLVLGTRGRGKSTLVAALHSRGHALLSDDITSIRLGDGRPAVNPAMPQIKLWPETITALGGAPESLPRIRPGWEKRALSVRGAFGRIPVALGRIYLLADAVHPEVCPLSPGDALATLMQQSCAAPLLRETGTTSEHFRRCADLARQVSVCRLGRPPCLAILDDLAALVEMDVTQASVGRSGVC